jgi:uncharacterized protein (TIGR03437 family)
MSPEKVSPVLRSRQGHSKRRTTVYSTYLGGSCGTYGCDIANALVVDGSGNAYIAGSTSSSNSPVTQGAFQTTNHCPPGGGGNALVSMLDPSGSTLLYSTYLGGSANCADTASALALGGSGDVYVTGHSASTDFPVTPGAFKTTQSGIFVANLNLSTTTATIAGLSPGSVTAGGPSFTLTVNGTNFAMGATVYWGNTALTTTFVSATQLTATVPASLIATAGTVNVTVASGGGTSTASTFTIVAANGSPCLYTVSPVAPPTVAATGGTLAIAIQTSATCAWSVSGLPAWITVSGKSSGAGPATVALVVAPNTGAALSANIAIAGQTVAVSEAAGQVGIITTVAGNGLAGFSGDGGPATSARLASARGVAVDASGNLFIADAGNHRIRKVSAAGIITSVTTSTPLDAPISVAVDGSGNLFIADGLVYKVSTDGTLTTAAGSWTGTSSGDGGPATAARIDPNGVAVDTSGNLFIADMGNHRIRKVSAATGIITTVAGNGNYGFSGDNGPAVSAELYYPGGVAVDASGNLFIADNYNYRIRKVPASGIITTVAGNGTGGFSGDGGQATSAELALVGVAVDASGNLFIADAGNNRIRKVSAGGIITTVAGDGYSNFSGDGGPATSASLSGPMGVAVDAIGNLFISDTGNNRVRKVPASAPPPAAGPSISPGGIVPAGSTVPTIQPGEWVSIYGANLASSTVTWNGDFPTSLGGTSVTINGRAAYLSLVSPGQINLQAPGDTTTGPVPVVVTTAGGSVTASVTLAQFGPSFFLLDAQHVAGIILRSNGSGAYGGGTYDIIGPTGKSLGYPTVAAKAGDTIELFAGGLGPTNPAVAAGQAFSSAAATTNPVKLLINNLSVTPAFAGLSGAGLYQINLTVPAGLGTGDISLAATVGGAQTPAGVVISLQ